MTELSLEETIAKIHHLIDSGIGDQGRLYYILETMQNHRHLYRSDRTYLEAMLKSKFQTSPTQKNQEDNPIIKKIEFLINSGKGDVSRLQHINDAIVRGRYLYHSDRNYLDLMLSQISDIEVRQSKDLQSTRVRKLDQRLAANTAHIEKLEHDIQKIQHAKQIKSPQLAQKLRGTMPQGWAPPSEETVLTGIYEQIKTEEEKIQEQKSLRDTIAIQQSKLTQLILNRQEYEKQVTIEKAKLEDQIKKEQEEIARQTMLSEQLLHQQSELRKVQEEREQILNQIKVEKDKVSEELAKQKEELLQVKLEQSRVESQVQQEKIAMKNLVQEQKARLEEQSQLAKLISEQQFDLESTKKQYETIASEITAEKKKLEEEKKVRKSIQTKERVLQKSKEKRLALVNEIEEAQKNIAQRMDEEKSEIEKQTLLVKELEKQRQEYDVLRREREEIEEEIQKESQRIKKEKERLRKEIAQKSTKLKKIKNAESGS